MAFYYLWLEREERSGWFRGGDGIKVGDWCLVEGGEWGEVRGKLPEDKDIPFPRIIKVMEKEEIEKVDTLKSMEKEAYRVCKKKIKELLLPMELIRVRVEYNRDKITFYFTAPGRVDFRKLVKELARIFRVRIEMRQIGARDKAKLLKGIGPCGYPLCCATFLKTFEAVNIRTAKEQKLPLDPFKIGGWCGRLRCCLSYEYPIYRELKKNFPREGSRVSLPEGEGEVVKVDILRGKVTLKMEEDRLKEIDWKEYQRSKLPRIRGRIRVQQEK